MREIWEERIKSANQGNHDRNNYSRDRSRVIHSAFFRRLQGKTQVLGVGESDFYRTRLTHSLEVAQIAGGISEFLQNQDDLADFKSRIPEQNLVETIGLAHDIGHPPFGHGGEVALNYMMAKNGGFEGNAQTLRICTELGEHSDDNGLNLTRRSLLGLIKYPSTYSNTVNLSLYKDDKAPLNIESFKPPKCIFDDDGSKIFDWIINPFSIQDRKKFKTLKNLPNKHNKTIYKSLDSTIMELADDIAYGVHDLEDAIALNLVSERQWEEEVKKIIESPLNNHQLAAEISEITLNLFSGKNKIRKKSISRLVHYFITKCTIVKRNEFNHELLDFAAEMHSGADKELEILKNFVIKNVIKTPEVQTLEYKGEQMIVRLFEAMAENPSRLLPKKYYEKYKAEGDNLRVICDYIAGTTDDFATMLYHKIFTPSNGSIFERL